jgi:hypothetical protein
MKKDFEEYELILETHNPGDIAFIKSILIAENIDFYIQGENVAPYLFNALPMRLLVKKDNAEKAKEILKDIKLTYTYSVDNNDKE